MPKMTRTEAKLKGIVTKVIKVKQDPPTLSKGEEAVGRVEWLYHQEGKEIFQH